jgi:asparagine synthase (glutamine-hydrolysing)
MSGIFGTYYLDGRSSGYEHLGSMAEILSHRGPDGAAIWCEDAIGLGHQMLWTTPESLGENQPLANGIGTLVLTADARIDNRDELLHALNLNHRPSEPITDSQLILAAYEKWGEQCPDKLLGDFAFALWDGPKQQLFCARDHFGIKPFYYYASKQAFVFASELKAIFCLPEVPQQLNEDRMGDYLLSMFHDLAITSYQEILRLPPAHSITVRHKGIQLQSYWSPDPNREIRLGSDEEYAAKFLEIFTEAVRCRLRSAFPIGSTLSGGLDSSSISCVASKLLSEQGKPPLQTFSAVFDQLPECDERSYISAVVSQNELEPHYIKADQISPLKDIERMFWHQDEAFYAPNWSMGWALNGAAQKQGVRILLDGFDGDTTVSHGYGYLSELAWAGRWFTLTRELRGLTRTLGGPFWGWLWSYVKHFGLTPTVSRHRSLSLLLRLGKRLTQLFRFQNNPLPSPPAWSNLLDQGFVARIGLKERYQTWKKAQGHLGLAERERHYRNIATQGLPQFAAEVMDKSMAAFALEPRYPFWDKRLVEFCLALPPEQKLHMGWDRVVMRRAMANILPVAVQWRRGKTDFSPNLIHGLLSLEKASSDQLIPHGLGKLTPYLNIQTLAEIYQRFSSSKSQEKGVDVQKIWVVLSLALWLDYKQAPHIEPRDPLGRPQAVRSSRTTCV